MVLIIFSPEKYFILKINERRKYDFSKTIEILEENVKIIIWNLFAIFIALKILHVFKIFIFDFKNVHPILDFLTRQGKFILYFSDLYLFFYEFFSAERI